MKQYSDVYIANKCPKSWNDSAIRESCENTDSLNDPFGALPVTNAETGFTYNNYYCAICHQDQGDLRIWNPRLECPTLTGFATRFGNMSTK